MLLKLMYPWLSDCCIKTKHCSLSSCVFPQFHHTSLKLLLSIALVLALSRDQCEITRLTTSTPHASTPASEAVPVCLW